MGGVYTQFRWRNVAFYYFSMRQIICVITQLPSMQASTKEEEQQALEADYWRLIRGGNQDVQVEVWMV